MNCSLGGRSGLAYVVFDDVVVDAESDQQRDDDHGLESDEHGRTITKSVGTEGSSGGTTTNTVPTTTP
jgi:hypothetical protein